MRLYQVSDFQCGLDWAIDALRKGTPVAEIEALTDASGIDPTDFDRGAREALRQYKEEGDNSL